VDTSIVRMADGSIYVMERTEDSPYGFVIHDDDQSWDGGFGLACGEFEEIEETDPRITEEDWERLETIVSQLEDRPCP